MTRRHEALLPLRPRAVALSMATATLWLALGAGAAAAAGPDETVVIGGTLAPAQLEVDLGTTVTWRNEHPDRYRIRSRDGPVEFDSADLDQGDSFSFTLGVEGSYPYYDHRDRDNAAYVGTIIVAGPATDATGPLPLSGGVAIIDRSFRPASFDIAAGGTVEWSNDDTEGHTVSAVDGSFNSGILTVGGQFSSMFETIGTFGYCCAIHPEMTGTVTVTDAAGGALSP